MQSSNQTQQLNEIKVGDITPTKFGLDLLAESIAEQVVSGQIDSIDTAIRLNAMEQLTKMVKEKISDQVLFDLAKYPKSKAEINGITVSEFSTVKYDYSHLPGWAELDQQITALSEKRKEIEDTEKKYHRGDLPIKSSTVTFKIQIPK